MALNFASLLQDWQPQPAAYVPPAYRPVAELPPVAPTGGFRFNASSWAPDFGQAAEPLAPPAAPSLQYFQPGTLVSPAAGAPAITDYQGNRFDPYTTYQLALNIGAHLDPNIQGGGAWDQAGQSIGFDYNEIAPTFQAQTGRAPTIRDQIALDIARQQQLRGVTDFSKFGSTDIDGGKAITYDGKIYGGVSPWNYGGDANSINVGQTFTGPGGTTYRMTVGPDGTPMFQTTASDSADFTKDDAMGILAVLGTAFGGAMLNGESAAAGAGTGSAAPASFGYVDTAAADSILANAGTGLASAAAPTSFGYVDTAAADQIIANAAGTGGAGGNSLYSLSNNAPGSTFTGQGLQVDPGTGLDLAATHGPGIQASLGPGLEMVAPSAIPGGLGLSPEIAGTALLEGAGLGNGLAYGSGTLLGPEAISGTYTMADGTMIPGYTSTGVPISPDFPFAPPSAPGSPMTDKLVDKLTDAAITAGIGALAGGAGGGSPGGDSGPSAEDARQKRIDDAIRAINEKFGYGDTDAAHANKLSREGMYTDISSAVRDTAMRDIDRQYTKASRQNTYGLAQSGLMGGSADAESGGELQSLYGEGRLKATQQGMQSASDLRTQDEKSRQNLITIAQGGLDVGTAGSLAAGSLSSAADLAKQQAQGASVGRLFDDMSQAYVTNRVLNARYPNGLPQQTQTAYGGNNFAPSRYVGRVQGG